MSDPVSAGSVYLLDAHGLIFQMFYGVGPMTAPDGRPTNAVFGVTRALMNLYDRGAEYLIATLDNEVPTFRVSIDKDYKAHRDPPPDDLVRQEPLIQQVMEAMRIPFLMVPGYEADDIMATVSSEAAARGLDVFLCTADKDCRQLITDKVKLMNMRKDGEILDAAGVVADWGVRPDQVIDFQSLVGDAVDNVPGVKGVGPKTASKWLQQYNTLDNLVANADAAPGGPKVKQALKDAIATGDLEKSKRLVTLDKKTPIQFDWEGWKRRDWDGPKLLELFHEFGFRGFAERVRKTLASSGAKKNAEALATAGLSAEPLAASRDVPSEPATPSREAASGSGIKKGKGKKAAPKTAGLFDELMEEPGLMAALAPTPAPAPVEAAIPTDTWSYDGYETVDTEVDFDRFLANLKKQKAFVFDLETAGLNPWAARSSAIRSAGSRRPRITCRCGRPTKIRSSTPTRHSRR
jgi:DNA polymerase I